MLKQELQKDMTTSLKQGDQTSLKVLRFILSEIGYAEIDKQHDLTDEETVNLLQKEVKKRKEAIDLFKKGNRIDLVDDEEKQIQILCRYIPQQLSEEEVIQLIAEAVDQVPDKHMGKIISFVLSKAKNRTDGATVARLVKSKLQ